MASCILSRGGIYCSDNNFSFPISISILLSRFNLLFEVKSIKTCCASSIPITRLLIPQLISFESFISPLVKYSSLLSCLVFSKTINVKILKGLPLFFLGKAIISIVSHLL